MENTYSIYIESLDETWQMPDKLALSFNEFEKNYTGDPDDKEKLHLDWYISLAADEQKLIDKK